MRTHETGGRSRRAVLRAGVAATVTVAAGVGVTGCDLLSSDPPPPEPPDPLTPLLAGTTDLIARYEAAVDTHPDLADRLLPVLLAHRQHATELAALIGAPGPGVSGSGTPTPAASGAPADARGTLAALRTAEAGGRRAAADACLTAPGDRAMLLGTIAAARASHAEVLR